MRFPSSLYLGLLLAGVGSLAAQDKTKGFPAPNNTEKSEQRFWSPKESLAAISVPSSFRVQLAAHEPDVQQPIAMTMDHRGRLWVAENYTYSDRTDNFDLKLRDRLVILEDVDRDGRFEKRKVFWDQGQRLTSVEIGMGGVWVLCAPQMLFIPDANGDDVPDSEPQVVLDGWNDDAVRHNIVNGLRWGPDGWLYGRHGILATSFVGKPGTPQTQRTAINCGIWRFHPKSHAFEVVATGTTNPWGLDFDEHGHLFFINTVIGHLWHTVPGAHFKRMYGVDFNPHLYGLIDQCADHFHWDTREAWNDIRKGVTESTSKFGGGHAHSGFMIYQGDNWPKQYRNNAFTLNLHGRRINRDYLDRRQGGFVGKHRPDILTTKDPWFRGIELMYGPDGSVFIADWYDVGECHENDGVHRTSGRIYKVSYALPPKLKAFDLSKVSDADLADMQTHENEWFVRQAQRVLHERALAGRDMSAAHRVLRPIYRSHPHLKRRLRAMWALFVTGGADKPWLLKQLNDEEEHVRIWAIKLLVDQPTDDPAIAEHLTALAKKEKRSIVRLYLASALQRLPYENRLPIARQLAAHSKDALDPAIPLMIWYGLEPTVPLYPAQAVRIATSTQIPQLRRYIARRLTSQLDVNRKEVDQLLAASVAGGAPVQQLDILNGMHDAMRGWRRAKPTANWQDTAATLSRSENEQVRQLVQKLSVVFGDGQALADLQKVAFDGNADANLRQSALRTLIDNRSANVLSRLPNLVNDRVLGVEAVRGLATVQLGNAPKLILTGYSKMTPDGRGEAINTLASRPSYAAPLLFAVRDGRIARSDITAFHARQMLSFEDKTITSLLRQVWGEVRKTSVDKQKRIEELRAALSNDEIAKGDKRNGRALFKQTCANCHRLFGQGGKIGPDLTGANRFNLSYLLENIVDPSATMVNDFKVSTIRLDGGRILTGVVLDRNQRTITLQTQREQLILPVEEVAQIRKQDVSLMPDGLLKQFTAQQIRDLFAFLSSQRPPPAE